MKQCDNCHSFALNIDPNRIFCDVCYYKFMLSGLLAVIFRDGGKTLVELGYPIAVEKAKRIVSEEVVE